MSSNRSTLEGKIVALDIKTEGQISTIQLQMISTINVLPQTIELYTLTNKLNASTLRVLDHRDGQLKRLYSTFK